VTQTSKKVGLVFGGRSVEHLVSVRSARTVADGLAAAGHEVVPLGIAQDGAWLRPSEARRALDGEVDAFPPTGEPIRKALSWLAEIELDVIFPIVHGTWGEDGALQGLAEMLDVAYVGPGVATSAVAMDKVLTKRVLESAGVDVVPWAAIRDEVPADLSEALPPGRTLADAFPLFVKPSVGGSSVGIRKVKDKEELKDALAFALRFWDEALIEESVVGRELEVAVLGYKDLVASRVGEIVPGKEFYDYEDKYVSDGAELHAPADLPEETEARIRDEAVRAFRSLGGHGMARVDFFLEDGGRLYLNEMNTLPGFTAISMYPRLWGISGKPLPELVDRLVGIAVERFEAHANLDAEVKSFVASLQG
jgi:D-alanine-D-alanine ligase